jgi:hypothetical protein
LDDRRADRAAFDDTVRHRTAVEEAFSRASLNGHDRCRIIRAEGRRAAGSCLTCGARLYVDWNTDPAFMEGEVFEIDCRASNSNP